MSLLSGSLPSPPGLGHSCPGCTCSFLPVDLEEASPEWVSRHIGDELQPSRAPGLSCGGSLRDSRVVKWILLDQWACGWLSPASAPGRLGIPAGLFQPKQDLWHGACTPVSASPSQSPGSWLQNPVHQHFPLGARLWAGAAQGQASSFLLTWLPAGRAVLCPGSVCHS